MAEFALIFRSTRSLTPEELPIRNAAARDWALSLKEKGVLKHAFPLEQSSVSVEDLKVTQVRSDVASVLVIEERDVQAAVALAVGHPGMRFGTEIEVLEVKSVAPAAQQK